jgi:Esterase/lipase
MGELSFRNLTRDLAFIRASEAERVKAVETEGSFKKLLIPCRDCNVEVYYYKSANKENAQVIFDIHGGGFVMGHAALDHTLCMNFMKNLGTDVIAINYRLAPEYPYPAAMHDVYDVVSYFSDHAGEYGIDKQNMSLCGYSAGGNLAAAVCIKAKKTEAFSIKTQMLVYPFLDACWDPYQKPRLQGGIPPEVMASFNRLYIGRSKSNIKSVYVSPVYATQEMLKTLPPAILLTAENDPLYAEGERYASMLIEAGVPAFSMRIPGAIHGFIEIGADEYGIQKMPTEFQAKYADSVQNTCRQGLAVLYEAYRFFQTL